MKTFLKIAALAAFACGPALAQTPAPVQPGGVVSPVSTPSSAINAAPAPTTPAAPAPATPPLVANPQAAAAAPGDAAAPAAQAPTYTSSVRPEEGIGQPDGRTGLQDQVTPIGEEAAWFHDVILIPAITVISLIVLALMLWVILRYRRAAHPIPSRTTHNTMVEVLWTLIPVIILVVIAIPSIRLLAHQYSPPQADLTIKVIGNQWYWNYEYPDHGIELTSNMLPEQADAQPGARFRTDADGPRMLAVDERIVVPVGATVKLIVTAADVLHSFAVPAFWVKMDAVPGRLNETWFRADRPGVYFGQCSELCGSRHAYMPIAVEVVSQAEFARWVASRGGTFPNQRPADAPVNPDSTQANTLGRAEAAEGATTNTSGGAPTQPAPSNVVEAVETPPTSRQGGTNPNPNQ